VTAVETGSAERGRRKVLEGRVVSAQMEKSIVVEVVTQKRHPVFKKLVKRSRRFMAHDEQNESHAGDTVRIMETRPLSRRKRWRLVAVLERAK